MPNDSNHSAFYAVKRKEPILGAPAQVREQYSLCGRTCVSKNYWGLRNIARAVQFRSTFFSSKSGNRQIVQIEIANVKVAARIILDIPMVQRVTQRCSCILQRTDNVSTSSSCHPLLWLDLSSLSRVLAASCSISCVRIYRQNIRRSHLYICWFALNSQNREECRRFCMTSSCLLVCWLQHTHAYIIFNWMSYIWILTSHKFNSICIPVWTFFL